LELQVGDKLLWKMDIQDGERVVIVRKQQLPKLPKVKRK
jgi:hypothetical protein